MLYLILRPITRFFLKLYFRKIYLNGIDHVPEKGPIILCSNHPTAFLEPCLLACLLPRELYFLVRADLFKRPLLSKVLYGTNQLPIYRFRDGIKELRNSHTILNRTYENVAKGNALLIFPEASTTEVRYLRPIKKGAARMALDILEKYPDTPLKIIPIGMNYSAPNTFRSTVNIEIGEAIIPKLPKEKELKQSEIRNLTEEIRSALANLITDIDKKENEELLDSVLKINNWRHDEKMWPRVQENEKFHLDIKKISDGINQKDNLNEISEQVKAMELKLEANNIELEDFTTINSGVVGKIVSLLIAIPVTMGLAINLIPFLIGKILEIKYVREKEFKASVLVAATIAAYALYLIIVLSTILFLHKQWAWLVLVFPFIFILSVQGRDYIMDNITQLKQHYRLRKNGINEIKSEGITILEKIKRKQ